ncbi:MAG TPA: winged helix-turn-helix domain-containing protein [Blastocatellia bacterium]|jgi:DNA-binding response OmpR family regulator|nr:winged helix-turn-helix domain-containing protein [Blastocatellia bacterium]
MGTHTTAPFTNRPRGSANVYDDGYLRVEHDNHYVACGGRYVPLSHKEFLVLSRIVLSAGRIVPSEEIWLYAWGTDVPFNPRSLRVYVYRLRQQLDPLGVRIDSMVRVGYRLSTSANPALAE